ncbi:hypothetical protein Taro_011557 [Colocasia esculenta]|uniref:Uncharacterized protein n=1 Tax=Colocasia esculenta TaxID=4460 RepID=A0A843UGF6_COLES|nr:hypothetical protein [Colocasia esculenta]
MNGMEMGMHGIVIGGGSAGADMAAQVEAEMGLRRGPWSVEEDLVLVNFIAVHGEGRWNSLARSAGLKRSGKSCRLRWLNYLRPDVRRGNFTPEEQLFILELHSRWGNRWSKIAQHLPGRTDNEIKNYWRTRVQKHAKQLKCDVNSQQFKDAMRYLWMPRLMERIQAASASAAAGDASASTYSTTGASVGSNVTTTSTVASTYVVSGMGTLEPMHHSAAGIGDVVHASLHLDHSAKAGMSSESPVGTRLLSAPICNLTADCYAVQGCSSSDHGDEFATGHMMRGAGDCSYSPLSPYDGYLGGAQVFPELEQLDGWGAAGAFLSDSLWAVDDIWFLQQRLQMRDM